jgi:hypothetical protein
MGEICPELLTSRDSLTARSYKLLRLSVTVWYANFRCVLGNGAMLFFCSIDQCGQL